MHGMYIGRGGFIKAKGTYEDNSPFGLYYRWGWCSSGGADCGWEACFKTTLDELLETVKANLCNELSSIFLCP